MTSKFEREMILPAYEYVQAAKKLEADAGTQHGLGFGDNEADLLFSALLADWEALPTKALGDQSLSIGGLVHGLLRWYDGGCPRFRPSHGLTTELALTDPTGVPMSEVGQPFPTYLIELPRGNSPIIWNAEHAGVIEPAYLLVHHVNEIDDGWGELPRDRHGLLDHLAALRVQPSKRALYIALFANLFIPNTFMSRHVVLGETIAKIDVPSSDPSGENGPLPGDEGALTMAWRLAFNLPLYLKHRPSGSTLSGKTVNHDHGDRSTLYEIGSDVKLNMALRDAARASCNEKNRGAWNLATRFIVRGHWKQQPHGPGRTERKMIFVQPYWKGSADSPLVARAHVDKRT